MLHADLPLRVVLAAWSPIKDFHAKSACTARRGLAYASCPYNADRLAVHIDAGEVVRLRTRKLSGTNHTFALDHPARDGEYQPEMNIRSRLRDNRRNHGDGNAALGRFCDVDIVGRDRHRADRT